MLAVDVLSCLVEELVVVGSGGCVDHLTLYEVVVGLDAAFQVFVKSLLCRPVVSWVLEDVAMGERSGCVGVHAVGYLVVDGLWFECLEANSVSCVRAVITVLIWVEADRCVLYDFCSERVHVLY